VVGRRGGVEIARANTSPGKRGYNCLNKEHNHIDS